MQKWAVVTAWGFGTKKCNTCGSDIPAEDFMCCRCRRNLDLATEISQRRLNAEIDAWKKSSPFTAKW